MNRKVVIAGLMLVLAVSVFAQDLKTQKKELAEQIATLYQKGELEKAVQAGEKLVALEKDATGSSAYKIAVINLARIERDYYTALENKLTADNKLSRTADNKLSAADRKALADNVLRIGDDSERLFREALEINEKAGKGQTVQTADIKQNLAWIIYNHSAGAKTIDGARARIDEAEKLYLDSIALNESLRGKDADETLFVARDIGDFYLNYVNFEKALSFYERFIQTYGQKHGENHPNLVAALRSYASILFTTMQDGEAAAAVKRIETIIQKKEPLPKGELDLYLRSKDAVAYSSPIFMEFNQKAETFRNKLKAEGKTLDDSNRAGMPRMIFVFVRVEVDETGKVTKAEAVHDNDRYRDEAEATVSKWTVRPFSYNGTAGKMRGILTYRKVA